MEGLILVEDVRWAAAAVVIAAALGLLKRSRLRTTAVACWSVFPALLMVPATLIHIRSILESTGGMVALVAIINTVPWAVLVLLSFNLVRWLRERASQTASRELN